MEIRISNSNTHGILARLEDTRRNTPGSLIRTKLAGAVSNRRFIRYGIIALNIALLLGICGFLLTNTKKGQLVAQNSVFSATGRESSAVPLDQLSSADIAANAA